MYGIISIKNSQAISTLRGEHSSALPKTHKGDYLVAFFSLAQLFQEIQFTPPKCQEMPPKQKEGFKRESS